MKRHRVATFLWVALALVSGCSKFKGSHALDMGPFAENTVTMLAEAQASAQPLQWIYLRDYRDMAATDTVMRDVELVRRVFRGIGFYSIQVVALNNARLSDHQRALKLADYIEDVTDPIMATHDYATFGSTAAQVDSVLKQTRAQTTYLGALAAANPLVYSITTFCIARVDRIAGTTRVALQRIQSAVDTDFAATKRSLEELDADEEANVQNYLLLQDYRAGKTESLEPLLARDPSLRETLQAKGKPSAEAVDAAQRTLQDRLASIDEVRKQLGLRKDLHTHQVAELDEFRTELDRRNRTARLMLIYWMRSHSNLAQGVAIPPAINMEKIASDSAKKALKSVP